MPITLEAVVSLNKTQFDSGLLGLKDLASNAAGAMAYAFGGVTGELMTMYKAFGTIGVAVASLKEVVTAGVGFEQMMANVQTVTAMTNEQLAEVEVAARNVAASTKFTAEQAAEALYALGSAGYTSGTQLQDMLVPSLHLAGATQAETAMTTELLTSAIMAFQLQSTDATKVANLFAGAIAASPADMNRLFESFTNAAPVAAAFGVTLEETVETLAAFHTMGIMGSEAGTAFRQAMTNLNDEMVKGNSSIGAALSGWVPSIEGVSGAIARLEAAGITGSEAMTILGDRGGKAVSALLAVGSDKMDGLTDAIKRQGDAAAMYATQLDTVSGQWDIFLSMINEEKLQMWDKIKDAVKGIVVNLQEAVTWFSTLTDKIADPNQSGWDFFKESMKKAFDAISKYISDNKGTVIVWAKDAAKEFMTWFGDEMKNLWSYIQPKIVPVVSSISKYLMDSVPSLLGFLSDAKTKIVNWVMDVLPDVRDKLKASWSVISPAFSSLAADIGAYFKANASAMLAWTGDFMNSLFAWMSNVGIQVESYLGKLDWKSLTAALKQGLTSLLAFITTFLTSDFANGVYQSTAYAIGGLARTIILFFSELLGATDEKSFASNMMTVIGNLFAVLAGFCRTLLNELIGGLLGDSKWMDYITTNIILTFAGIRLSILSNAGSIVGAITDVIQGAFASMGSNLAAGFSALGMDDTAASVVKAFSEAGKVMSPDGINNWLLEKTTVAQNMVDAINQTLGDLSNTTGGENTQKFSDAIKDASQKASASLSGAQSSLNDFIKSTQNAGGITLPGFVIPELDLKSMNETGASSLGEINSSLKALVGMKGIIWA